MRWAAARLAALGIGTVAAACGGGDGGGEGGRRDRAAAACERFAVSVVDHEFGAAEGFAQGDFGQGDGEFPERVLGGPRGAGCCAGSQDVTSLGNGGFVVVGFGDTEIVDGPGPDFLVAENAFWPGGDESRPFAEPGTVAVSDDGERWVEFPCTATEPPFGQCAGWRPVLANVDDNDVDPLDPDAAGGDPFDLADAGLESARLVRITDRADLDDRLAGVFDLDAVTVVHARCP